MSAMDRLVSNYYRRTRTQWRMLAARRLLQCLHDPVLRAMQSGAGESAPPDRATEVDLAAAALGALDAQAEPLIIIGAHRSGTSLVTQVLQQMGLFVGAELSPDLYEAYFFQDLNRVLMQAASATWESPTAMYPALAHAGWRSGALQWLATECQGLRSKSYVGWRNWQMGHRLPPAGRWGWKDPRSTITLPLWLHLYPRARVLHVYRNGVDVSQSLVRRQEQSLQRNPRLKASPRCLTLAGAFEVWIDYMARAEEMVRLPSPDRVLEIRYEDFLAAPNGWLGRLAIFAGLSSSPAQRAQAAALIRSERAYAFAANPALYRFYKQVEEQPHMRKFGYTGIAPVRSRE
ncbi:MAG: sulfotransferase [Caldilineaceae bacterium]